MIQTSGTSFALAADGSELYVAASGVLRVVDLNTQAVTTVPLPEVRSPVALALVPAENALLIADQSSQTVAVVGTTTRLLRAQISVGVGPRDIAVGQVTGPCRPPDYTPRPTSTPTPTVTVTPTKVPTFQCPPGVPCLQIGSASIPPGGDATITVHLATAGQRITGIQNDVFFDSAIAIHDCSSNLLAGGFHGSGSSLRAVLYSPAGQTLSDGALLYSCTVTVASGTPLGRYPLLAVNILAADALGNRITVAGADGEVVVTGSDAATSSGASPGTTPSTAGGCQITDGSSGSPLWLGIVIPMLLPRRRGRTGEFRRLV